VKRDSDLPTVVDRPASKPRVEPDEPAAAPVRYEVGAEIARGGMGRVVEATDTVLGRSVAVKEALSGDGEAIRRFRREIAITARLEHPSIVPVHDAGTLADGAPFYVMRKVSGRPLTELIAAASTLEQRLALLPHIVAAAQALAHAHKRGVVHRDIKPSNILAGELGETVVIDWGLAKVVGEVDDPHGAPGAATPVDAGTSLRTRIGAVFGTPGFMAPEQVRGEEVGAHSDVYALGATLYYTLTRSPPHASASETEMMTAAASGPARPIGELVPGLPRELSTIVDKALAFDDRRRYPDAGALAEDLQRFLTGQLVASHHYSPRERVARFARRNKLAVAVGAVALATVTIGGALAVRSIVRARDRADAQALLATQRQRDAEDASTREKIRGDQLQLMQAETLAATNPTAAVAMLKSLATPPERWQRSWRQARAIAATARFNGVAHALPAASRTFALAISPQTTRALSRDLSGQILIHDLVKLTTTPAGIPDAVAMTFAGEDTLVAATKTRLIVRDLATGAQREAPLATGAYDVVAGDRDLFVLDDNAIVAFDLATLARRSIDVGQQVETIKLSNDHHWLAIAGVRDLFALDLERGTAPKKLGPIASHLIRWSGDSTKILGTEIHSVVTYFLDGTPPSRRAIDEIVIDALAVKGKTYFNTAAGLFVSAGAGMQALTQRDRNDTGNVLHDMAGIAVVARSDEIEVFDPIARFTLHSANGPVGLVATSHAGRHVIAATTGHVLVWDLSDHYPASARFEGVSMFSMIGNAAAMALPTAGPWEWIDFKAQTLTTMPALVAPLDQQSSGLHDASAVAETDGTNETLFQVHGPRVTPLDAQADAMCVLDDDRIVLGTPAGDVVAIRADGQRSTLARHAAKIRELATAGTWLAIAYADGLVIRIDLTTNHSEQVQLAGPALISIRRDGTVYPGVGRAMLRWQRDGLVLSHALLPMPITLQFSLAHHTSVTTSDGGAYSITFDVPAQVVTLPANLYGWLAYSVELGAYAQSDGAIRVVDLATGYTWPMALPHAGIATAPAISDDGAYMGALIDGNLQIWQPEIPQTPEDTARWLDRLTNASAELGTATLTFH
jgi:protein kinase-like protein